MRGCFESNGSAQNGSKRSCKRETYPYLRGTVPYRTVPKSRVNAALDFFKLCTLFSEVFSFYFVNRRPLEIVRAEWVTVYRT